jgi:hypothetical protein
MDDTQRNRVILVLVIAVVILAIVSFVSSSTAYRQKVARDQEMLSRLEVEEKMNKVVQEDQKRNFNVRKIQEEMVDERISHQQTKEALVREQLISQSLREELEKKNREQDAGSALQAQEPAMPKTDQQ